MITVQFADSTPPEQRFCPQGPGMIRLMLAMSRATIQPFTNHDWMAFNGAVGDARSVVFQPADHAQLLSLLGVGHWSPDCVFVVLDEHGLTWNGWSPTNGYAWQVCLQMLCPVWDGGTPEQYAEVAQGYAPVRQKLRTWVWSAHGVWHAVILVKLPDQRLYHHRQLESELLTGLRDLYGHGALDLRYGPPPEGIVKLEPELLLAGAE